MIQSKPVLSSGEASNPIQLLKTHQNNSGPTDTEDDMPLYSLSRGSDSAIQEYIESSYSYSLRSATQKAVSSSFALIACLYGDDTSNGNISPSRRFEAVSTTWRRVVSDDVYKDIGIAQSRGDSHGAIFAAMSGGDLTKASSLAFEGGHSRLALMLASSGITAQPLFESQLEMWIESGAQSHIPKGIIRIFSLARGCVDTEENLFKADSRSYAIDWRRRLGMYLWSCHDQNETEVSILVKKYRADVSNGVAPSPLPIYVKNAHNNTTHTHKCVLYEILSKYSDDNTTTLASIVSPASHTKFHHDYFASFHLAAAMTAMTGSSLTLKEEYLIIDSISSQLIMSGSWEWAVYVTLSMIGNNTLPEHVVASRMMRAKSIISMFYTSNSSAKRSFLEKVGVPSEWFSAALAYRSANEGQVFAYVEHLMNFSVKQTLSAIESIIIPCYILGGEGSSDQLMNILHSIVSSASESDNFHDSWEATRLCKPIYDFLCISKDLEEMAALPSEDIEMHHDEIDNLIGAAAALQDSLSEYREICSEQPPLVKVPLNVSLAPCSVYLAEVIQKLANIQLQLLSLKNGTPFEVGESSSGLAFALNAGGLFETGEAPVDGSILRGVCGFSK